MGALDKLPEIPAIENEHLSDARLYANRNSLVCALPIPRHGKIAEIGVWRGNFSKLLLSQLEPAKFIAFDIFTGHLETEWHGLAGNELFSGLTHRQYYEQQIALFANVVTVIEGPSALTLRDYTDRTFDLVYVDAAHGYHAVKADAALAVEMVADSGFLIFNDYTLIDPSDDSPYGVVPVVNDLVVNHGWRIAGFALHEHMFCDIALCRQTTPAESAAVVAPMSDHPESRTGSDNHQVTILAQIRKFKRLIGILCAALAGGLVGIIFDYATYPNHLRFADWLSSSGADWRASLFGAVIASLSFFALRFCR